MESKTIWAKNGLHMLSPENVEKVKVALLDGRILGHHYHYCGGCAFPIWAHSRSRW